MSDRYFALRDHVGVTADGNLEPLVRQGLTLSVPTMADGEVVETPASIVIEAAEQLADDEHARVIPGTRIIQARDPRVVDGLLQTGHYEEIDPPTKTELAKLAKSLTDASEEAGTHEPDPAAPGEEA